MRQQKNVPGLFKCRQTMQSMSNPAQLVLHQLQKQHLTVKMLTRHQTPCQRILQTMLQPCQQRHQTTYSALRSQTCLFTAFLVQGTASRRQWQLLTGWQVCAFQHLISDKHHSNFEHSVNTLWYAEAVNCGASIHCHHKSSHLGKDSAHICCSQVSFAAGPGRVVNKQHPSI